MANARKELLNAVENTAKIKCASIVYGLGDDCEFTRVLKVNYTQADYNAFLLSMNFEYDNGLGCQELFGTVWLEDGTWLARGEYDGSEWWEHMALPPIPDECL